MDIVCAVWMAQSWPNKCQSTLSLPNKCQSTFLFLRKILPHKRRFKESHWDPSKLTYFNVYLDDDNASYPRAIPLPPPPEHLGIPSYRDVRGVSGCPLNAST